MTYTDVINTTGALVQAYPELLVYLGNASGAAPTTETFSGAHCLRVVQSAGGQRLDFAELQFQLTSALLNRSQPADFTRMIDVKLPDAATTRIHRGDYVAESIAIDKEAESLTASSQLRPYHFGYALSGYDVWNPIAASDDQIDDDIVFNPVVDNKTVFNRSNKTRGGLSGWLWTHPELCDSSVGETYQGQTRNEWTIETAVEAVCELLNPLETFIDRPTDYSPLLVAPPVRDIRIPLGARLPEALDTLLIPHGFNWYIDYSAGKPKITLFKIGSGPEKELKFQAPPAALDLELSNVNQLSVSNSIADAFNEVLALGEFEEAELTIPLYPGWPADQDNLSATDLSKDGTEYIGAESAYRLFIANEAGDIDPAVARFGVTPAVPDFTGVFSTAVPHRRVLGEPLTYMHGIDAYDGGTAATAYDYVGERPQRMPIVLEWSDDSGATWQREKPTWTVKLCPDQIGILFDMVSVPEEIYTALNASGNPFRMRITGTVFGDWRVTGFAAKQSHAVNGRDIRQVYKVPDKFQHRWRQTTGTYASALYDTGHDADERDDTAAIADYAEKLRDQNHYAEVDGEYRLPGWHTEYEIGDLITKIAGREISLNAAPTGAPENRYPQVVERRFEISESGGPSTVLVMDRGTE